MADLITKQKAEPKRPIRDFFNLVCGVVMTIGGALAAMIVPISILDFYMKWPWLVGWSAMTFSAGLTTLIVGIAASILVEVVVETVGKPKGPKSDG